MNKFFLRTTSTALLALALLAVSGCGNTIKEGKVVRDNAEIWAAAKVTPYPVGEPFTLDGCKVQMYRIAIGTAIGSGLSDVTLSTVDCPTASVTASSHSCGRACTANMLQVTPVPKVEPAVSAAPVAGR